MTNSPNIDGLLQRFSKDEKAFLELKKIFHDLSCENSFSAVSQIGSVLNFEGYFVLRTAFNKNIGSFIEGNVESVCGYTAEELSRMPGKIFSIIYEDDLDETKKEYSLLISSEKRFNYSLLYRILDKEGKVVWLKESLSVKRDDEGHAMYCDSIYCDVTELIREGNELKEQHKKMQELLNEKDKFLNIISHDLRAPFTSLLGFSEILMNEPGLPHNEKMEYLEYIHSASQNQLQFINHILDWSRLKTGKIKVELKRMRLRDIVANMVSLSTHDAIRKNVEIKVNVPDEIFVNVEERLMGQVISNFLTNAIKFSSDGQNIFVTANKFKEGMIEIVVKDEGIGISEANQSRLFRMDQKFVIKGTKGEKGSGMGLILAKEIISQHKGEIWFYSKENEGCEFHFTIPEAINMILIVEDDTELRNLYKTILSKTMNNFEIIEASNGYEAITFIYNQMPSLVITDHDMPLMSGAQLVEAIRKKDKRNSVPVIVISAKFDGDIKKKYEELGVKKLIPKPFTVQDIGQLAKEILEN